MRRILSMSRWVFVLWLATSFGLSLSSARAASALPPAHSFRITRLNPALDDLISPHATLRTVATGFGFIDGPVWIRSRDGAPGYLLASDIIENVIYKVTSVGKVSVFLNRAGYSGTDFAHVGKMAFIAGAHVILMGPSDVGVDPQGRLIWCAAQDRALMRLEANGTRTVLTNGFEGKRFNGPNDLTIAENGAVYFTDSDVGLRGGLKSPLLQMPDAVWMWRDGKVSRVLSRKKLGAEPNGITLSPHDKYLYLSAGTGSADPRMMRYPVHADGTLGPGIVFTHGRGIGDGMRVDHRGDVYSTDGPLGIVRITSKTGRPLGLLNLPTRGEVQPPKALCASALAFGGSDAKTLYITACDTIYAIHLRVAGILQGPAH